MSDYQTELQWADAMRQDDFAGAWQISDDSLRAYLASPAAKHSGQRHVQRIWRGESLAGKRVLVRCYHGLGDTIQFIRFAPALRRVAREVIVWVQPQLMSLVGAVDGVDRVLPLHDGRAVVDHDVDIEIMELAHALRVSAAMTRECVPYLSVTQRHTNPFPSDSPEAMRIGLVWEVGDWDKRRCVPPQLLGALRIEIGAKLFSLQQGPARAAAERIPATDVATPDIQTLAGLIMKLDLVITVDTMVAHLCGALGAPVWTMLHSECDWRWPQQGSESTWYPTMRLFHQSSPGRWEPVVAQIVAALPKLKMSIDLGDAARRWPRNTYPVKSQAARR